MANLKGVGGASQRNLIASYKDSQVTEKDGKVTGAFLTVEIDQSVMTQKAAKEGKADTNPYLASKETVGKDGTTYVSHTEWYSQGQIDAMRAAGDEAKQEDGRTAIAFKSDIAIYKATDERPTRVLAVIPKDLSKAKDDAEFAKMQAYNEKHPIGKSDNKKFGPKTLASQEKITGLAKASRQAALAKAAPEAEKSAEAEAEAC